MKTKNKLLKAIAIIALLLGSNQLIAQTNTSPTQTVCAGSLAEPYLINPPTAGSTYQWTLSGGGTLNSGATTDNITVDWGWTPGTYTITVTETDVNGCPGAPRIVDVTVQALPTATIATSQTACFGSLTIPDLFAIGANVTWYDDVALTSQVGVGNYFATLQTAVGLYTYYVTESLNGCEGPSVPVTLEIYAIPSAPTATNEVACEGGVIPDLTTTVVTTTPTFWYSDAGLTAVVGNGSIFATGQTAVGIYTYYVSEIDVNGCESAGTPVTLEIYALPSAPTATNEVACEGGAIPDLTAAGTTLTWYSDAALTLVVGSGTTFATGQTGAGVYTYYVSETDVNSCESNATTVTLEIYALPAAPTATNEVACEGGVIPDLTATGTTLTWYSDAALTLVVGSGTTFATLQTTAGVYTYYVSETDANGCEGAATIVTLTINSFTTPPLASAQSACFSSVIPDLTATGVGSAFTWYSDAALTAVVGNNSPFATGQTAVGVYTYYVTESQNGCESPAAIVTLTIYATPTTGPINHW
jgi:hypothetical protein